MILINQLRREVQKGLNELKIKNWNTIQSLTLPLTLKHQSIIGVAPTGSGKTLAYVLPILEHLDLNKTIQAIVIAPTRELARQIQAVFQVFKTDDFKFKSTLIIGGVDIKKQISQLKTSQILVCTPSRLLEILQSHPSALFSDVKQIVLDETDMLLDLGFAKEIVAIFEAFKNLEEIQKMAFSATIHDLLGQQLAKFFKDTKIIKTDHPYCSDNVNHYLVKNNDKFHSLSTILNTINPYLCLIFANTKKSSDEIYKFLLKQNRNVINLHGGLKTRERKNNFRDITKLKYQYVVCSDLASRGLDINGASHVISFDFPEQTDWYIHRAGRAGRNKYEGESYILLDNNSKLDKQIEELVKKGLVFKNKLIKNNHLVSAKYRVYKRTIINQEQEQEIKQLVKHAKQDVKPGYKKKLKKEIAKVKQKHKRKHIEMVMKNNRIKQYKKANSKA